MSSKHKKSQPHTQPLNYDLVPKAKSKGFDPRRYFALTIPFNHYPYRPLASVPNDHLTSFLKKIYLRNNPTESDYQVYNTKITDLKTRFEQQMSYSLSCCKDTDPVLNIWSPEAQKAVIDTIDFREYIKTEDITTTAFDILQKEADIASFWSPNEFVDIIISDAVFYRVRRILYDTESIGVRYTVCEYNRVHISDTEILTVPINMFVIQYCPMRIENNGNRAICDLDPTKYIDLADTDREWLECRIKTFENDYRVIETVNLGRIHLGSLAKHMNDHHDHLAKPTYRLFKDMFNKTACDIYGVHDASYVNQLINDHLDMTTAMVVSAIIVTNSYLRHKQLSKPIASNVKHAVEIILQNRPDRKTRILGSKIEITSETRPTAPDEERLIKYHIPEWGRKAHLRHLKNGQVIEIPAGKCQRRCVDMSNVKSKLSEQAVDYVIKPENPLPDISNADSRKK